VHEPQHHQNRRGRAERRAPVRVTGERDDPAAAGDHGQPVAHGLESHEPRLLLPVQRLEVEAVDGDVVGGRQQGRQQEQSGDDVERPGRGGAQGHEGHGNRQGQLGGQQPAPLGGELIDKRRPEKLEGPRQAVEGG